MWTFFAVLAVLLPIVSALFFFKKLIKTLRAPSSNYSFGRKDITATGLFIQNKKFRQAETMLEQFNSDDLTQAVDHIALSSTESQIKKYYDSSNGNPLSSLLLGAWYLHNAWRIRGNKPASELKEKQIKGYIGNLKLSAPLLESASGTEWLASEAYSRLIRVDMGLGNYDTAEVNFKKAIKVDKEHLWSYIHYSECIQPKWGGSIEQVQQLLNSLPDNYLIKNIVRLKLLYDSYLLNENYFKLGDTAEEVNKFISDVVLTLDAEISENPPESIQRYVLYGYIYALSSVANKDITKKYKKLVGTNLTLYPFGIIG